MRRLLAIAAAGFVRAQVGISGAIGRVGGVPIRRGDRRWWGGIGRRLPLVYTRNLPSAATLDEPWAPGKRSADASHAAPAPSTAATELTDD